MLREGYQVDCSVAAEEEALDGEWMAEQMFGYQMILRQMKSQDFGPQRRRVAGFFVEEPRTPLFSGKPWRLKGIGQKGKDAQFAR